MTIKIIAGSEIYVDALPQEAEKISAEIATSTRQANSSWQNPRLHRLLNMQRMYRSPRIEPIGHSETIVYAPTIANFTLQEVLTYLEKGKKLIENTENYLIYSMQEMFNQEKAVEYVVKGKKIKKKFYGPPPGTVRFYSRNLICVYDGGDWHKL